MNAICIIPARGGSKRIPRKNIKPFLGVPIIAYSIRAALESGVFDTVMVSTDDEEIATVSREYGADVPFFRSTKTADDHATLVDVLIDVLRQYQKLNVYPALLCCLLPTAPFVHAENLRRAFESLNSTPEVSAVVPVVRFGYPIQRALSMDTDGCLSMVSPEYHDSRSQDLAPRFHDAGQYYMIRVNALYTEETLFPTRSIGVELPEGKVQDIDTDDQWRLAEIKYGHLHRD